MSDPNKTVEEALGLIDVLTSQCVGKNPDLKPTLARLRAVVQDLGRAGSGKQHIDLSSQDFSTTHFLAHLERTAVVFTLLDRDIISDLPFQRVRDTMRMISDAEGPRHCVVDLSKVRFISSVPVGCIVTLNREVHSTARKLVLCKPQPVIREFFSVTKLDTIIPMAETMDQAMAMLQ